MSLFRFLHKKNKRRKKASDPRQDQPNRQDSAKPGTQDTQTESNNDSKPKPPQAPSGNGLDERLAWFHAKLERCGDFAFHPFQTPGGGRSELIYIQGFTDQKLLLDSVMESLMQLLPDESGEKFRQRFIDWHQMSAAAVHPLTDLEKALDSLFESCVLLLMDNVEEMLAFPLPGLKIRSVNEAPNEKVVRGPREAFIEDMTVNLSLIRRRLKHPALKMEEQRFGTYSNTSVYLVYVEGLCRTELIEEVKNRLSRVKIDGVLGSSYLEEYLEDNPYSPFPQIQYTERPDIVTASLLEGRLAVMVDGTPNQLIVPANLFMFLQSAEDYYQRFYQATWIRWIRYAFTWISLFLPSLYIAVTTFHPEMLPTNLLLTVAASREIVPFPALVEALLMELMFEAIREGVLRAPQPIGQTVTVVGGLVIGQAAIQAGIVSAPLLIVVAVTGIASFVIPHFDFGLSLRLLRFPLMLLAGSIGLLGIALGVILLHLHLLSLRSFGSAYLSPVAPLQVTEMQDVAVRAPWWSMKKRPSFNKDANRKRLEFHNRPHHSEPEEDGD